MLLKIRNIAILLLAVILITGCSMKKNTSTTRAFKALNTRYNVYFNGMNSYEEGIRNINQANTDDYASIINMYAISKHENANAAKSNMDRTIEKCRKAIKLRSIKQKPERDAKKWKDLDYQAWYNQKEFNPALKDAWLLLAKAEFHKGDFLGAVGTFTYISRFYANDKDMVALCQLWMARSYSEMGWIYEAEQVLLKLKQDDLKTKNIGFFAAVNADLLLKKRQYKEALPFLEISLKNENDKVQKQRFTYLLAQLYHKNGNTTEAFNTFTAVTKLNPPYEMDFNARIYRAELSNNIPSVRKELKKMIANPNNKEYKDQLYYVLGKTYLQEGDTVRAIDNFIISADTSSRNGYDKAVTLITLGDLYYNKQNYIKAQPCYDEASKIITAEKEDYTRVSKRAETLSELVVQYDIVSLQDSLQRLAALPMDKQKEIIQKIIDKLIADEKAAEEAEKNLANQNRPQNFDENFDMMPPIGMAPQTGDWYFYNPTIIKSGITEFRKKWGTRKLEDNWRRTNKTASLFNDESASTTASATGLSTDSLKKDSVVVDDTKSLEFYLRQIPVSKAQFDKSNEELANALYNMGFIYKDKVEDLPMAIKTFDEFERRFPTDERRVETYYYSYLLQTRLENAAAAEGYKAKLIANFPNSKYVEVISQPDYFERLNRMYEVQDSLYFATYKAYNASDFKTVKSNSEYIQKTYPLSTLLPKFFFLNALSVGKTEKPEVFETTLLELVEKYPKSDVSSMSKDILALIKQGNEAKAGTSSGSLLARRDEAIKQEIESIEERKFVADKTGRHRLMLLFNSGTERLNKLLFNVAAFNFTRFMVKDFDLINTKLDSTQTLLSVTNFESFEEAEWYLNSVKGDSVLNEMLFAPDIRKFIISETNFGTMFSFLGLDAYIAFLNSGFKEFAPKQLAVVDKKTVVKETKSKVEKPVAVSPIIPQKDVTKQPELKHEKDIEKKPEPIVEKKAEALIEKKAEPTSNQQPTSKPIEPAVKPVIVPKMEPVDNVPLFKNLFAYRANEPHFMAISVLSGTFDFEKLKTAFDAFNAKNYGMLNLKVTKDVVDKQQIIIIGSFADAGIAKSYLFRIVQETALYEQVKGTNYRNLIGSQRNLNVMMQQNAMDTYFEFMQEYYLK